MDAALEHRLSSGQLSKMRLSGGLIVLMVVLAVAVVSTATTESQDEGEARLFAYQSTTTVTSITTTTITGLSTCLSVNTAVSCVGRRRKRTVMDMQNIDMLEENLPADLAGSEMLEEAGQVQDVAGVSKDGRGLTLWSTEYSTLTITSSSLLASTTVSVSALCSVSGLTEGCF